MNRFSRYPGFTLVELLVVIAIIGVVIGLMMPAIQSLRESGRRSQCQQNLLTLGLAMASYHDQMNHFPVGTVADRGPIRNEAVGYHHNWISAILPQLDCQVILDHIDFSVGVYDDTNARVRAMSLPYVRCPSATNLATNTSAYAGIHASVETPIDETNDGVFILNEAISRDDITDGLSYTLLIGEKISHSSDDLGWMSGTRSTLRNTGTGIAKVTPDPTATFDATLIAPSANPIYAVGGLSSHHAGGVNLLTGGGEITFRDSSIDSRILQQMANRSDGQLPIDWDVVGAEGL
tara:strand:- start:4179 stop:5054 length:876 start_codon:yes stop_codon:yes gene_type:complete